MAGFWLQVLAEVVASCPVFAAGLWISHRKARRRLDEVTRAQNVTIAAITREQTSELTGELLPRLSGEYHGHGDQDQ